MILGLGSTGGREEGERIRTVLRIYIDVCFEVCFGSFARRWGWFDHGWMDGWMDGKEGRKGFLFEKTKSSFGASQCLYFLARERGGVALFCRGVLLVVKEKIHTFNGYIFANHFIILLYLESRKMILQFLPLFFLYVSPNTHFSAREILTKPTRRYHHEPSSSAPTCNWSREERGLRIVRVDFDAVEVDWRRVFVFSFSFITG